MKISSTTQQGIIAHDSTGVGRTLIALAIVVFSGSAVGAVVGARYLERIPEYVLTGVFALVMAIGAVRMMV